MLTSRIFAMLILIIMPILPCPKTSYAGIEKLIENVMPSGTMSNISKGAIVNDQLSGHVLGGSVAIRTPATEDLQLVNFQAPTCRLGGLPCAAQFDLRGGALSFIKSREMMNFLKTMVQNAGVYGGVMAVKTICPQCEDIMTWLEAVQRNINNHMQLSCNSMMTGLSAVQDKLSRAGEVNRQSNLVMTGGGSDMTEIAEKSKRADHDPTTTNKELEGQLGEEFNLVWKALDKKAAVDDAESTSLKELLMSISGTIVIKKGQAPIFYATLVNKDLIEEYIGLGKRPTEVELYQCSENSKCLEPKIIKVKIAAKDTLYGQINDLLTSIVKKVKEDKEAFSAAEENLIALSSLPLVKKIQMDLAIYTDSAYETVKITEFIEALCYDVVTTHLTKLLQQTQVAVTELSYLQLSDIGFFDQFNQQATDTIRLLSNSKALAFKRYEIIAETRARMIQEESYFEMKFEEYLNQNYRKG